MRKDSAAPQKTDKDPANCPFLCFRTEDGNKRRKKGMKEQELYILYSIILFEKMYLPS